MDQLSLGVLATSSKENEHRLPIHPEHFDRIDADLRAGIVLEHGYGDRFGFSDEYLATKVAGLRSREQIMATSDVVLLPKPTLEDVASLHEGQVLWGWPHAVQDFELTQICIDKRLTLIAWEAMNNPTLSEGGFGVHVFHLNNELAGYCSVLQAMTLIGATGHYGRPLTAAVIGFGNTARGAITALNGLGVHNVTAITMREVTAVASPVPSVVLRHLDRSDPDDPANGRTTVQTETGRVPTATFLAGHDIVVNCVMQDTDAPLMFASNEELAQFSPGTLFVDVSCDEGMGFGWARPTTFDEPLLKVGNEVSYYGVDHSPSYLWNSSTWCISEALIPYLRPVMAGGSAWDQDRTIRAALEIRDGVVQNPKILSFHRRAADYPHPRV